MAKIQEQHRYYRAKLIRGSEHGVELIRESGEWFKAHPSDNFRVTINDDRLGYQIFLDPPRPPVMQWATILGDFVHNLRAAMDIFVWSHVDHRIVTSPQRLGWPLVEDEAKWENKSKECLEGLDQKYVERIRETQPFHVPPDRNTFAVLHALDIADKHHLPLAIEPRVVFSRFNTSVKYKNGLVAPSLTGVRKGSEPQLFSASSPIAQVGTKAKIASVLSGEWVCDLRYGVETKAGWMPFQDLVLFLSEAVAQTLVYVSDDQAGFGGVDAP